MFLRKWLVLSSLAFAASLSACNCGGTPPDNQDQDSGTNTDTDGGPSGGGSDGGDDAGTDGGTVVVPTDPFDPANGAKDSDCDGLTDQEEYVAVYAGGRKTLPGVSDTDGDGIKDGVELGRTTSVNTTCNFMGDADSATRTIPTDADSDADSISDGLEDASRNGVRDTGETDPANPDSDGDQLKDGAEDVNHNGVKDSGETDPRLKDTDNDLISDGIEKNTTMTDPLNPDHDGDTCKDGLEDLNYNGVLDPGETNPKLGTDCGAAQMLDTDMDGIPNVIENSTGTNPNVKDSDADGLEDGLEDTNKNGVLEVGETNPRRKDTDCDGLIDGPDNGMTKGEDQNANAAVNGTETNPRVRDTDGDGVRDGVERGVTVNPDAAGCTDFIADADPATTTDATDSDSDNDGIADGAEDTNQNGRVDPGELNPKSAADVMTADGGIAPAGRVCTADTVRNVTFRSEGTPDIQIAVPPHFTEIAQMTVGGTVRGLIGYGVDPAAPTNKVAFVLYKQAAPGGSTTPTADEAALRTSLNNVGLLTNPLTQTFTTWDGFPAVQASYDQAGSVDLKAHANAIANALVGGGAGALAGSAAVTGPFKLQAEYVHRSATSVVVLIALTASANYVEPGIFTVGDVAGGSALAQFGDANAVQCETFAPTSGQVDFLFVVDDSCSMKTYQNALANSATAMVNSLNNSSLDWRIALVTSAYAINNGGPNSGSVNGLQRTFTRSTSTFQSWLTSNPACTNVNSQCGASGETTECVGTPTGWVGICGNGTEQLLNSGTKAIADLSPGTVAEQANKVRQGATVVVILLGDADDQSGGNGTAANYSTWFNTPGNVLTVGTAPNGGARTNNVLTKIPVHGIICPAGQNCNETQNNPQKHAAVITATNGIRGDITTSASITTTINAIVNSTIAAAGHRMAKPPIGASVKVAMDAVQTPASCNKDNLPRSRVNGFDFDGVNGTLSFFGACRPSASTTAAAVSYRYWVDTTTNPNGTPPPCVNDMYYDANAADFCQGNLACNLQTNICECPSNCGSPTPPPPTKFCNTNRAVCAVVCTPDCGGTCTGYQTCNQTSCGCDCQQNATCPVGFTFQSTGGVCGCVCNTAALNCAPQFNADPNSCSCVCKSDCGGCVQGTTCNQNTCACVGSIG
ncbi:MAG: adventurous gliding motility lipoprotein CglD [Myxococcaceae bacterium]